MSPYVLMLLNNIMWAAPSILQTDVGCRDAYIISTNSMWCANKAIFHSMFLQITIDMSQWLFEYTMEKELMQCMLTHFFYQIFSFEK